MSYFKQYEIKIDTMKKGLQSKISFKQTDRNTAKIVIYLKHGGNDLDLTNCTARLDLERPDGQRLYQMCNIIDVEKGIVEVVLKRQVLLIDGTIKAELVVKIDDDTFLTSTGFTIDVKKSIMNDDSIENENDASLMQQVIEAVDTLKDINIEAFEAFDNQYGSIILDLERREQDMQSLRINAKYPPVPLVGAKGNANFRHPSGRWYEDANYTVPAVDDSVTIKNIIDYAHANKLSVEVPTATYLMENSVEFPELLYVKIKGGHKDKCRFLFTSDIGFVFKRGVVNISDLHIIGDLLVQSRFLGLQLGDAINTNESDSLHWSKVDNIKITGVNKGLVIANCFDSSVNDIEIFYLVGNNARGVEFIGGTYVNSNNILFNRLHIEHTQPGSKLLDFNAGPNSRTANFTFSGCHFETRELNTNVIRIANASNITFISTQISHTRKGNANQAIETDYTHTFEFENALSVKFISCGIGGYYTTNPPIEEAHKLFKLSGINKYIDFDTCMISPPYQNTNYPLANLFNIESGYDGDYPEFSNCMINNKNHTLDKFLIRFNTLGAFDSKAYIGMGTDHAIHITPSKWDLSRTPDDPNNYKPFSSFLNTGMFKTAGILGRHSGTVESEGVKQLMYHGRTGVLNSGMYIVNILTSEGVHHSAIVAYDSFSNAVNPIFLGDIFSVNKDVANKVNFYGSGSSDNNQLNVQNRLTQNIKYSVVPFLLC